MAKEVKIFMVGGRRAGKTSVLAAMERCMQTISASGQIGIDAEVGGTTLAFKQDELQDYFYEYESGEAFSPDLLPSFDEAEYCFSVKVSGKKTGFRMKFVDIPGEWLTDEEHRQNIEQHLKESHVVIIAVDSPHLMEKEDRHLGYGRYHKEFNRVNELTNFFKNGMQNGFQKMAGKMVIFVPIKCEKYYWLTMQETDHGKSKMKKLNEKVKAGYSELLAHFASGELKDKVSVAITPVVTLGGAEFHKFSEDSYVGEYCFVMDSAQRRYAPQDCEQPLLLILDYVLELAASKRNGTFWEKWINKFRNAPELAELQKCSKEINKMIKTDTVWGFEKVQ